MDKAAAQGARHLLAQAKLEQSSLSRARGDSPRALALLQEASDLFDAIGDLRGEIAVRQTRGTLLWEAGDFSGATKMYREVADRFREMGNTSSQTVPLSNLAAMHSGRGHLVEAAIVRERTLRIIREGGDKGSLASHLSWMGQGQYLLGEPGAATKTFEEAIRLSREVGSKTVAATVLQGLAAFRATQAPPAEAKQAAEQALVAHRAAASSPALIVSALTPSLPRCWHKETWAARARPRGSGSHPSSPRARGGPCHRCRERAGRCRCGLRGRSCAGLADDARRALELFRAHRLADEEAFAEAAVGRALLAAEKPDEALHALGRA